MDYSLNEHQSGLQQTMREFVEREIPRETARAYDRGDEFPWPQVQAFADLGLAGINVPREYGGQEGDIIDLMLIFEQISKRLPVLSWALGNILLYGNEIIGLNGSEEQKQRFLPRLAKGEIMFSFAITEPDAGSDAASIRTRGELKDGSWILNGSKMFITGAGVTDYTITFARTAPGKYDGITSFIVDTKDPGYSAVPIHKLGYHGSNTCTVTYEDVKVPPENILGGEAGLNRGWQQEMRLLNQERLVLSSCALGMAEAAFEDTLSYVRERLGRTNGGYDGQTIRHGLAEMGSAVEAIRQLIYSAAWKEAKGHRPVRETSMSKLFSAETAKRVILRGLDLLGEDGPDMGYDLQRYLRDILILSIGGGTSQIQKNIIGKTYGV